MFKKTRFYLLSALTQVRVFNCQKKKSPRLKIESFLGLYESKATVNYNLCYIQLWIQLYFHIFYYNKNTPLSNEVSVDNWG